MFYSDIVLAKKGALARVWLASHLDRKLSKAQIHATSIQSSVGDIIGENVEPMALRLSGQLLLGVARIYSRKARYLLDDCNDAMVKLKMAFRPAVMEMPAEQAVASHQAITHAVAMTAGQNELLLMPAFGQGNFAAWAQAQFREESVPPRSEMDGAEFVEQQVVAAGSVGAGTPLSLKSSWAARTPGGSYNLMRDVDEDDLTAAIGGSLSQSQPMPTLPDHDGDGELDFAMDEESAAQLAQLDNERLASSSSQMEVEVARRDSGIAARAESVRPLDDSTVSMDKSNLLADDTHLLYGGEESLMLRTDDLQADGMVDQHQDSVELQPFAEEPSVDVDAALASLHDAADLQEIETNRRRSLRTVGAAKRTSIALSGKTSAVRGRKRKRVKFDDKTEMDARQVAALARDTEDITTRAAMFGDETERHGDEEIDDQLLFGAVAPRINQRRTLLDPVPEVQEEEEQVAADPDYSVEVGRDAADAVHFNADNTLEIAEAECSAVLSEQPEMDAPQSEHFLENSMEQVDVTLREPSVELPAIDDSIDYDQLPPMQDPSISVLMDRAAAGSLSPSQASSSSQSAVTDNDRLLDILQADRRPVKFDELSRGARKAEAAKLFFQVLSLTSKGLTRVCRSPTGGSFDVRPTEKLQQLVQG